MNKKILLVEDILEITKELSFYQLITKKMPRKYKILILLFFLTTSVLSLLMYLSQHFFYAILILIALFILYCIQSIMVKDVFKQHYPAYLHLDGSWDKNAITCKQKNKLKEILIKAKAFDKETVSFLLQAVEREYNKRKFPISTVSTIILSTTTASWFAFGTSFVTKNIDDYNIFAHSFKLYTVICFLVFTYTLVIELLFIRAFKKSNEKYQNALLRALENVYLELCVLEKKTTN